MSKRRSNNEGSIFKENSTGSWVAEISLPDGARKRKRSKSQQVVREWLQASINQLKQGNLVVDDRVTVSEFIDRYFNDVARHNLRPKTLESYESLIRIHIKPGLGHYRLSALNPLIIQKFYSDKLNAGLSKRTVQFIHSILHKALNQALRLGLVYRNVTDLVDHPNPKRKAPEVWSIEEVKKFLNAVKDHRFFVIYLLSVYLGMREGEVLGIYFEDVDILHRTIHVKHAVQALKGGLVVTEPKTESSKRAVSIPSSIISILTDYLYVQKRNQGLIFTTSSGKPISPRNLVRHFKSAIKETGLPNIRFHDLRHTHASLLLAAGVHPKIVQERLGHSQISLTLDTYSHVIPSLQLEAADKMDQLMGNM